MNKPEDLAIRHSQIIDQRLAQHSAAVSQVKAVALEKVSNILSGLLVDDQGRCIPCKENRVLINRAFNVVRSEVRGLPGLVGMEVQNGEDLMVTATTEYIKWLKS